MSGADPGWSMYHISPQRVGNLCNPEPKITFRRGASLVSCELGKAKGGRGKRHDWIRGAITEFSKGARRRALRLVASLRRDIQPVFATLTYPDIFDSDPRRWKRDQDTLFKRILRRWPSAVIVWKMEPKKRKSGENKGVIAPHHHLLVYNVPFLPLLYWLAGAWYEVVGSKDDRHLKAGTRVELVRSVRGVLNYTAKYICKSEVLYPPWVG